MPACCTSLLVLFQRIIQLVALELLWELLVTNQGLLVVGAHPDTPWAPANPHLLLGRGLGWGHKGTPGKTALLGGPP